jgi:acetyl esterase/lipase
VRRELIESMKRRKWMTWTNALATSMLLVAGGCSQVPSGNVPMAGHFTEYLHMFYTRHHTSFLDGDLYLPNTSGPRPTILLVHGGGWVWGYDDDWAVAWMARHLVRHGYAVFDINYRWAGHNGGFPHSIEDVKNAWAWLLTHRARYRLSRRKTTLVGLSAGAYLALMAAYTRNTRLFPAAAYPKIKLTANAVVAFYPPTNLAEARGIAHWWAFGVAEDYLSHWRSLHDGRGFRYASPITYTQHGIRTYIIQGLLDVIVPFWQADELARKLKHYHIPVSVYMCPYASHAFMDFPGPARQAGWKKLLGILRQVDH